MKVAGDSLITNPLRPLGVATDRAEEEEVVEAAWTKRWSWTRKTVRTESRTRIGGWASAAVQAPPHSPCLLLAKFSL